MKNVCYLILIFTLLLSCNSKKSDEETTEGGQVDTVLDSSNITDKHYLWTSEFDTEKGMIMKRTIPVSKDSLTSGNIITMINELYPDVKLQFSKVSGDSIFIKVDKSDYLTQQMGSSGAEAYLAEVTYNLTEIAGINYVDIRFKSGSHASAGTYARTDFIQVKE